MSRASAYALLTVLGAGVFLALLGLYFVVGRGVEFSSATLSGDLLMLGGVLCWATYSVASQPILRRHSP